ncbi:hypothetical protein BCR33DRAFT_724087 [Rhizoclosmatium globosum]|uniref:DUF4097 domain-containing protein n=1 Tax=Rhizoclosmatium globosum TaxID=329046 RepID=A0A1Y2B9G7_9FUNG|nr:hypothetical protein BCR33DRAFT_724087 [Rhizoclosmatium globosum]|eukprot:ORY31150.1 hypothetical protein BCR33DRAFT_724087 [Rhizoclosmatium globosum]
MVSTLLTQSVPVAFGTVKVMTQGMGVANLTIIRASDASDTVEIAYQVIGKNAEEAEATTVEINQDTADELAVNITHPALDNKKGNNPFNVRGIKFNSDPELIFHEPELHTDMQITLPEGLNSFELSGDFGSLIYDGPDLRKEFKVGLKAGSVRSSVPITAESVDIKFDMGIIEFSQKLAASSVSLSTKAGKLKGIYSGLNSLSISTEAGLVDVDVLCQKETKVDVSSQFGAVAVNAVGFSGEFEAKTQLGQLNVSGGDEKPKSWFGLEKKVTGVVGEDVKGAGSLKVKTEVGKLTLNFKKGVDGESLPAYNPLD